MRTGLVVGVLSLLTRAAFADTAACIDSAERGQQLRAGGHLQDAAAAFLSCQAPSCPSAIAKDCARWLDETERAQPSVVVTAKDESGHELSAVTLLVDGRRVADHLDGRAVTLDPGRHTLRAEWSEGPATTVEFLAREGERQKLIDVLLKRNQEPIPAATPTPVAPWLAGALGLVAVGTGVALWGAGLDERARLYDACGITRACTEADKSAAQAKLVAGDVTFFAGVATVLASAIWLAVTARHPARAALAAPVIRF